MAAAEYERLLTKLYGEANTMMGEKAEMQMGQAERRRLKESAQAYKA